MRLSTSSSSSQRPIWLPSASVSGKLFVTGATLGPVIDSLHNQCLLQYNIAPIQILSPAQDGSILFASSWLVPPLLGFAYVILGGVLPRIFQRGIDLLSPDYVGNTEHTVHNIHDATTTSSSSKQSNTIQLGIKAILAVLSTAAIIKFSEYLVLNPNGVMMENTAVFESSTQMEQQLLLLITASVVQWAYLDGTLASLLLASVASIGGPLSEIPFVAAKVWEYLPNVADYLPMNNIEPNTSLGHAFNHILGSQYRQIGLSSITGPCYFAVTMDSIALGRFFEVISSTTTQDDTKEDNDDHNDNTETNHGTDCLSIDAPEVDITEYNNNNKKSDQNDDVSSWNNASENNNKFG